MWFVWRQLYRCWARRVPKFSQSRKHCGRLESSLACNQWESLDSTLKFIQRSRTRIENIQADLTRQQVPLQQAMESFERLRDETASSVPEQVRRPQASMDVEDPEEAKLAELQHERAASQEVEESKAKKARVLSTPTLDLAPIHSGAASSRNAHIMQNFIDDVGSRYGLRGTRVGEASNPGPPKFLWRLRRGISSMSEPASTMPASVRDIHGHKALEGGAVPEVVDMSLDDSDHESRLSGNRFEALSDRAEDSEREVALAARPRRRRLVLSMSGIQTERVSEVLSDVEDEKCPEASLRVQARAKAFASLDVGEDR